VILACVAVAASLWAAPMAHADPVVPQQNGACSPAVADALTWPTGAKSPLVCLGVPESGYRWSTFDGPYPSSTKWLSSGPEMKLHGEGLQNGNLPSGNWTAAPQDPDAQCSADLITVVGAGVVSAPQTVTGEQGQPLSFSVPPRLFSIKMRGYCLWMKSDA
jgi:hypothetical protein